MGKEPNHKTERKPGPRCITKILCCTLLANDSCVVLVVQLAAGLDHAEGSSTHATSLRGHQLRGVGQRQDQHALRVPAERGHPLHAVPRHLDPGGAHAGAAHARALGNGPAHHFWPASGALCRHSRGVENVREQDNIERFRKKGPLPYLYLVILGRCLPMIQLESLREETGSSCGFSPLTFTHGNLRLGGSHHISARWFL